MTRIDSGIVRGLDTPVNPRCGRPPGGANSGIWAWNCPQMRPFRAAVDAPFRQNLPLTARTASGY